MTGDSTVAELCEGLDDSRRATAVGLMRTLLARGFARAVPDADPGKLPTPVADRYSAQINFVEHFMHDDPCTPEELFARFRSTRVLVSGPPGEVTASAIRGLLRNGLERITLDDPAWAGEFEDETAEATAAGAPAEVVLLPSTPADLAAFDVVVSAADGAGSGALLELTRRLPAGPDGPLLLPVVADPVRAVIGPISGPVEQPCWLCAQLRLSANSDPRRAADFWRRLAVGPAGAESSAGGSVTWSMIGNAVAFEIFRLRTGQLQPDDQRHAVIQDLTTLESRRERVLPHPGCPQRHHVGAAQGDQVRLPPADDRDAYGRAAVLVSPDLGLLSGWTDEAIRQIPLKTGRVRLGPAASLADGPREIAAFDIDTALVARTRAVHAAVCCYVGRLGPAHGTAENAAGADDTAAPVPAARLDLFSGLPAPEGGLGGGTLTARSLHDASAWRVPAAAVYPLSPANSALVFEPSSAGAAAGWSVEEVRERGLCSALARRGLVRAIRGDDPALPLPAQWLAGDDEVAFALDSLRHLDRTARVFALPGASPAFAVLAVVEGPDGTADWSTASALSVRTAVREAVRDAVGLAVGRHCDGVPLDAGDPLVADFDPRALVPGDPKAVADWSFDRPAVPLADALGALDADGTRALFVDTTTVDLRAVGAMVTGAILLAAK